MRRLGLLGGHAELRPTFSRRPARRQGRLACSGFGFGGGGRPRLSARLVAWTAQPQGFAVHHDLAPGRREDPDNRPDQRHVNLTGRATDHDDFRTAGPVDVDDLAESGAVDVGDRRADDLVPVELAPRQFLARCHDRLEVRVAQALGRGPVRHLGEAHPPALSIRLRLDYRQRRVAALHEQRAAHRESLLRPVGQRLDADRASQPVEASNQPDHQPVAGAHSARLSRFPAKRTRRRAPTRP